MSDSVLHNTDDMYILFFDGCSKGNPGKAGAGAVLYLKKGQGQSQSQVQEFTEIWSHAEFVGEKQTNNYAEYMGLILGLAEANRKCLPNLLVKGDSLLVIKQMRGEYQVHAPHLRPLYQRACDLVKTIASIQFQHVYRTENKRADALANLAVI
jgi:ribonuclease HI